MEEFFYNEWMQSPSILTWFYAVTGAVIAVLYWLAVGSDFFINFWWYDVLLHGLGGIWVGLLFLRGYGELVFRAGFTLLPNRDGSQSQNGSRFAREFMPNWKKTLLLTVGAVFFVGVAWEIFELVTGTAMAPGDVYPIDTIIDMVMDVLGAFAAYGIAHMVFLGRRSAAVDSKKPKTDTDMV